MPRPPTFGLSRRERQMMDVLYRLGRANAAQVRENLPDPPSYSAVRATLRILEDKGAVSHAEEAGRYVYLPKVSRLAARRSALRSLVETFFAGSPAEAAASLLGAADKLSREDLDRLAALVEKARKDK
jgi:predicted transcriptional regulator